MLQLKRLVDLAYETAEDDEMKVLDLLVSKKSREMFDLHLKKNNINVTWMSLPCEPINGETVVAKTGLAKNDDLDGYFMELYNEHGQNFHPYMFNKKKAQMEEDGVQKSFYMLRFGVSGQKGESKEDHLASFKGNGAISEEKRA